MKGKTNMTKKNPSDLGIRDLKKLMAQGGESLATPMDRGWGAASPETPWHVYQVNDYGTGKPHRLWSCRTRQSSYDCAKKVIGTYRKSGGYVMVFNYLTNETFNVT